MKFDAAATKFNATGVKFNDPPATTPPTDPCKTYKDALADVKQTLTALLARLPT